MKTYIKKEKNKYINDLARIFVPMSEKISKPYIKVIYDGFYRIVIKEHPYALGAISITKILTAQYLEKLATGKAKTILEEVTELMSADQQKEKQEQQEQLEQEQNEWSVKNKTKFI